MAETHLVESMPQRLKAVPRAKWVQHLQYLHSKKCWVKKTKTLLGYLATLRWVNMDRTHAGLFCALINPLSGLFFDIVLGQSTY